MADLEDILKIAEKSRLKLVGRPISDPEKSGGIILFVKSIEGGGLDLTRSINYLHRQLNESGFPSKIVSVNEKSASIEQYLEASLYSQFPELRVRVTAAVVKSKVAMWLNFDTDKNEIAHQIEESAIRFVNELGFDDVIVKMESERRVPSPTACLRILRRFAPCGIEDLAQKLLLPGFDALSEEEIRRLLDAARKKGLVVRRSDSKYVLTLKGLMELGSARNRFSPDIYRALALKSLSD